VRRRKTSRNKRQDDEQLSFAFLKHGAERSMDGLEQDAPATLKQPILHALPK
jgi:hypothetical protein